MNNKNFSKLLSRINACGEAQTWVTEHGGETSELWRDCERGDWMAWILVETQDRLGITRQQIVLALCDCAELSLKYFEKEYPKDTRPRQAIETARKWAKGNATEEQLKSAASAAADAKNKTLKQCADIFRKHFPSLDFL